MFEFLKMKKWKDLVEEGKKEYFNEDFDMNAPAIIFGDNNIKNYLENYYKYKTATELGKLQKRHNIKVIEPEEIKKIEDKNRTKEYGEKSSFEEVETHSGNFDRMIELLGTDEGRIIAITGGIGRGKTTTAKQVATQISAKLGLPICFIGLEDDDVPFERIQNVNEAPDDCILIIDEMARTGNSRRSQTKENLELIQAFKEARHHNRVIIFIDQEMISSDIALFRRIQILMMKEPELFQLQTDRQEIRQIYERANKKFKHADNRPYTYTYSKQYEGMIKAEEYENDD